MKWVLISLIAFSTFSVYAQEKIVQSGTPALLVAANGKKAKVMLQRMENGNLTFQPFKSTKERVVPFSKITSLQFFPKYDAEAVNKSFNDADYAKVQSILEPLLLEFFQYMPIKNNMQDAFCMLLDSYRGTGDFSKVRKSAELLLGSTDPVLINKAKVAQALAAIDAADYTTVEKLRSELESPAASLYLKAATERAQGNPKAAIKTVSTIIAEHANDLEWMPQCELLSAYLYLDMTGTNSVITTNSAINTARQVKNIYAGSNVAGEARIFWASLGGEKIEAEENAVKAKRAAAEKLAKEKRAEAEKKRRAEAKAKRKAAASEKAAALATTNLNTTTENESE